MDRTKKGFLRLGTPGIWALLAVVVAAAVAARSWLLWSTPLIPGRNGGYYLIQARALLERGALGIPDFPLTFFLHATAAKILHVVTGHSLEACITLAVRLCDAFLPPLLAIPVFLFGRAVCTRAGRTLWPAYAAAALAVLSAPALMMTGDFEKNSLGLVWLAGLIAAQHAWMTKHTRPRTLAIIALLSLCGLTHIGVFGVALLLTLVTWGTELTMLRDRDGLKMLSHFVVLMAASALLVAAVSGVVLWKFDPARIHRLAGAFSHPVTFLQNGGHTDGRGPGPGPRPAMTPGDAPSRFGPPPGMGQGKPFGGRPGGMPPPGPGGVSQHVATRAFLLLALATFVTALFRRQNALTADRATAVGCAATLLLLTGPWVGEDIENRLQLIAVIPAAFAAVFVMAHAPGRWTGPCCSVVLVALVTFTTAPLLARSGQPVIGAKALAELRTFAPRIAHPDRTLIVAPHGLEWWTAWALHTHVAQSRALRASDWSKYDAVLFIREKRHDGEGFPGMGDQPPPGFDGRHGGPPMMDEVLPEGAETLHDGTYFRLARVVTPPEGLIRPEMDAPPETPPLP
jgi:hypothetical protein